MGTTIEPFVSADEKINEALHNALVATGKPFQYYVEKYPKTQNRGTPNGEHAFCRQLSGYIADPELIERYKTIVKFRGQHRRMYEEKPKKDLSAKATPKKAFLTKALSLGIPEYSMMAEKGAARPVTEDRLRQIANGETVPRPIELIIIAKNFGFAQDQFIDFVKGGLAYLEECLNAPAPERKHTDMVHRGASPASPSFAVTFKDILDKRYYAAGSIHVGRPGKSTGPRVSEAHLIPMLGLKGPSMRQLTDILIDSKNDKYIPRPEDRELVESILACLTGMDIASLMAKFDESLKPAAQSVGSPSGVRVSGKSKAGFGVA